MQLHGLVKTSHLGYFLAIQYIVQYISHVTLIDMLVFLVTVLACESPHFPFLDRCKMFLKAMLKSLLIQAYTAGLMMALLKNIK